MNSKKLYPLVLKPVVKDYIWGGTRLKDEYGFETDKKVAAEGWMLASHKDGTNIVANGELKGKTLDEALTAFGYKDKFPVLIKLIDAKDRLSVQVHPDNAYALAHEGEYGKTEMWYIVDSEPGAKLIYGFNREIGREEFEERIKTNTLDDVMNCVPVRKGDVFFISAGTLHAIGKGILIAEIQQNSNTTYRVSDYGRLGADGQPRQLHIEKALDVTDTKPSEIPYGNVDEVKEYSYGTKRRLARCEYFDVTLLELRGTKEFRAEKKFVSLLVLDGRTELKHNGKTIAAEKGMSILVPPGLAFKATGTAEVICSVFK